MGKVNACLKRSYVIVTSLIAVVCALMLALTLFSHGSLHDDEEIDQLIPAFGIMYIVSILILFLAIIGVCGACKGKQWVLILYAVGMIISCLLMTGNIIQGLALKPEIVKEVEKHYLDMLPLSNTTEQNVETISYMQTTGLCCGLVHGYQDWGYSIPESCLCAEPSTSPCVAAPKNSSLFEHKPANKPIMIYKEPCLQHILDQHMAMIDVALVILMGVLLLWVVSVILCVVILCQLNRKADLPVVVYSQEAKAGNYTSLTDGAEYT